MRRVTTAESLEAIIGKAPRIVRMKETQALDEGCRSVLASSPIAGFGFRAENDGLSQTTLVGGAAGFARIDSETRFTLELPDERSVPVNGGGVSFVFLVPGIGETLRVNGIAAERCGTFLTIELREAYVHCARCILRSGLWSGVRPDAAAVTGDAVADFLSASPFVFVSSWSGDGSSDTSPRGDPPGFIRILDGHTLAIPDRRGNKRADTLHNLLTCDRISLAALSPGRDEILHLSGTAHPSDDPALLASMALRGKPPHLALVVSVERAEIRASEALRVSRFWDRSGRDEPAGAPDMNRIATDHIAANETRGAAAAVARTLSRGIAAAPAGLIRRVMDRAYRRQLEDEGY